MSGYQNISELESKLKMAWNLIETAEGLNKRLLDDVITMNTKIHHLEAENSKLAKTNMKLRMHIAIEKWETDINKDILDNIDNLENTYE
jgi:hypothetical protein